MEILSTITSLAKTLLQPVLGRPTFLREMRICIVLDMCAPTSICQYCHIGCS